MEFQSTAYKEQDSVKLSGFNNLTKVLSFNLYDFCIALSEEQKREYIQYINEKYNAVKVTEISQKICDIIEANVLSISRQDYDPVGASSMVLMSDIKGSGWNEKMELSGSSVNMHLDKSHITTHTYPDASDPDGICTFRVDIDIATCGEIIPLSAINYLFQAFEADVVVIDYVVRGYTRLECGKKIYNDHKFNSIQDFIDPKILNDFEYRTDMNLEHANTWQTKLLVKEFGPQRYLYEPKDQIDHPELDQKMSILRREMKEVFHHMS